MGALNEKTGPQKMFAFDLWKDDPVPGLEKYDK